MFGQTQWHFETCSLWLLWENCWKVGIYFVCVNYSIAIWNYVVCTWSKFKNVWFHSIVRPCDGIVKCGVYSVEDRLVEEFDLFMRVVGVRGINMVRISTAKGEKRFKELTDLVELALFAEFTEWL